MDKVMYRAKIGNAYVRNVFASMREIQLTDRLGDYHLNDDQVEYVKRVVGEDNVIVERMMISITVI